MSAFGKKLRTLQGDAVMFWCPGCEQSHQVRVPPNPHAWQFNGNGDAPTFTPSVLIRSGHYAEGKPAGNCWCDFEQRFGRKVRSRCFVCHSFVTDGRIQFLGDCTHALAGQTVDLPDFPGGTA